jgi:tetratricopeptide (TPR) repeat protein
LDELKQIAWNGSCLSNTRLRVVIGQLEALAGLNYRLTGDRAESPPLDANAFLDEKEIYSYRCAAGVADEFIGLGIVLSLNRTNWYPSYQKSPDAHDRLLSRYTVKTADRINTGDKDMLAVEQVYEAMQPVLQASIPEDAVRALQNIVRSFPGFARAHSDLGMLYYQSGEKQKAVVHYERAATISPENADFQKNLADYYYVEMARAEDALNLYSKVLQARPKDVETLMTAGHILVSLQRFEEADAYYRKVLEIEPWNTAANEIHNKLSQKSRGGNGSRKAEDMYGEVKRLLDLGDQAGARRQLEKMLGISPHFALAHNDLAVLCYQSGDKDQALLHYEEAVRLQPENSTFQKNLGDFYYIEQGRIEDALRIYVSILETQPKDIETLMATGHICSSLSRWDDARTFYRRVLEIEPWKIEAKKQLDRLENATTGAASLQLAPSAQDMYAEAARLVSAGSVQAGKDRLAELVKRHPGFALAHNDLGVLAYRAEDNQSALLSYQTAVRLDPSNLTFQKNLADLYWKKLGRIEDALKIYVNVMAAHPEDVETLLATGMLCLSLRQPNDARVFFERVLKIEPWNVEAHQQLRAA